jgi:hypothetical protein
MKFDDDVTTVKIESPDGDAVFKFGLMPLNDSCELRALMGLLRDGKMTTEQERRFYELFVSDLQSVEGAYRNGEAVTVEYIKALKLPLKHVMAIVTAKLAAQRGEADPEAEEKKEGGAA